MRSLSKAPLCLPLTLAACVCVMPEDGAASEDVVSAKLMALDLARDIAQVAVDACRQEGYQVSAVVVDRAAVPQVVMRDVYAPRFTIEIAERKANAVILAGLGSGEFAANRRDLVPSLNQLDDILVLQGGLPIRSAGSLLGAVGVSGAPGGEIDERCAQKALDSVAERLEFAQF
jgi:uncharacterized protein GlcG (DUF336 family)